MSQLQHIPFHKSFLPLQQADFHKNLIAAHHMDIVVYRYQSHQQNSAACECDPDKSPKLDLDWCRYIFWLVISLERDCTFENFSGTHRYHAKYA